MVGFAAETDDAVANGRAKLAAKGCDLLVVNEVGENRTFGADDNAATILSSDGTSSSCRWGARKLLGHAVWDLVVARLAPR